MGRRQADAPAGSGLITSADKNRLIGSWPIKAYAHLTRVRAGLVRFPACCEAPIQSLFLAWPFFTSLVRARRVCAVCVCVCVCALLLALPDFRQGAFLSFSFTNSLHPTRAAVLNTFNQVCETTTIERYQRSEPHCTGAPTRSLQSPLRDSFSVRSLAITLLLTDFPRSFKCLRHCCGWME